MNNDIWSQLRGESIHFALVALQYGFLGIVAVVWFYYRRNIQRSDKAADDAITANQNRLNKCESKLDEHDGCIKSHDRQIRDVRAAIEGPRAKLGLESFHYTE